MFSWTCFFPPNITQTLYLCTFHSTWLVIYRPSSLLLFILYTLGSQAYTQHYTISRLQSYSTPQGRGRTSDDPSSKLLVSHNLSEVENQRTSYPSVVKYQDIRPVPTLPTTYYTSNKDNWTPLSQDDVSITGTITLTNKMSYEQTSLMASNLDQTNQAPRTEANMTPEQERNTRIMACDIQRFYEYVQREKHVFRRWFSYYGINLATFLEPYCTLFKNERKWPEAWFDNEHELVNGLKTFQHMAKQLLQQWKQDVAAQILSVRNTALSRLFTAEDVSLAAKLEPNPLEGKAASLERAQSELAFDKTLSKFRFLADEMLQGMEGGPTIERPGHPWTRMEGFDVLNLMIKMQRILTMNTRRKTCSSMRLYPSMGFTRDEQALSVHGGEPVL